MSRRVVLITEIIAPYRIPAFNALAQHRGIDLHVIFLAENDRTQRQWLVYKAEIRFPYQVLPSWRRRVGRHSFLLNWGAEMALRRAAPDFIVCGGYNYLASWQSMSWARRTRVPFSLWTESTTRDFRNRYALIEFLKTTFLRGCDAFVVPGKSSVEYLRNYGVPEEMIYTAPNAVDTQFFAQRAEVIRKEAAMHREDLRLPARFFLFAGRLVKEKGIFDLLRAYGALAPEIRKHMGLVFVGDGPERLALLQRAAAVNPGSIQLVGFAQREHLAAYYALADVFVFPTHTDPWGLVVNEAMACGLPVVSSSAAGCVADLVESGWNGRVFSAGDVGQLACAMDELARNAELRSLMGQRSRDRIEQYSPEAWAAGMAGAVLPQRRPAI
ncbi:MAG TPA: glycosyltransferase family 4 protein [Candidatus Angelobacter sp.]